MNENSLNNLKPARSENEARRLGKNGGIKSGRSRRRKKLIKEYLAEILNSDIPDKFSVAYVKKYFPDTPEEEFNVLLLGLTKLMAEFIADDTKTQERLKIIEFFRDSIGERPVDIVKIDEDKLEEYEIDKKLAQLSTEELTQMLYGR